MCGICGYLGSADRPMLNALCASLRHRGPDDLGVYVDDRVGLGATRLSMIDLEHGHQPMISETGDVVIVFNGEFYDFVRWKKQLEEIGHRFATHCDTEVVLHMYEEYGMEAFGRIRGMYAVAIWDRRDKTLHLARDRWGVKPLYYWVDSARVAFASELRALVPYVPLLVSARAIAQFIQFRHTLGELTPIVGIRKVEPGHVVSVQADRITNSSYRSYPWSEDTNRSPESRVRELLMEAVRLRLVSDVPLGVFLSGGLDSAAVVALMIHLGVKEPRTYTAGFANKFDEVEPARRTAELLGSKHTEISVDEATVAKEWHTLIEATDDLIADPASVPTYYLSSRARIDVKGVLLGEGADEVFGGYEQYRLIPVLWGLKRFLGPSLLANIVRHIPVKLGALVTPFATTLGPAVKGRAVAVTLTSELCDAYGFVTSITSVTEAHELMGELIPSRNYLRESPVSQSAGVEPRLQQMDIQNFLPHLLDRVDRMTMAHSIEGREPFLDYRLADYVLGLPSWYRVRMLGGKVVLRRALRGVLPTEVIARKKNRFFVPIQEWLDGELGDMLWAFLDAPIIKLYNREGVAKIRQKSLESPLYYARPLWSLLVLESWLRSFDRSPELAPNH